MSDTQNLNFPRVNAAALAAGPAAAITVDPDKAIEFPNRFVKLQAEHAIAEHHARAVIRNQVSKLVSPRNAFSRQVTEVVPLSEDNATVKAGAFIVRTDQFEKGRKVEGEQWFHTVLNGHCTSRVWSTFAEALVHMAARMINGGQVAGGDETATHYAMRVLDRR